MASSDPRSAFELEIPIFDSDIDQLGHVNNVVYLRWVQDVAVAHWSAEATEENKRDLLWVVTRHEIEYRRPAFLHDEVLARTWIGGATAKSFERHTELLRKVDGKLLARALTLWCPIDFHTRKPVEVSQEIRDRFSVTEENDPQ